MTRNDNQTTVIWNAAAGSAEKAQEARHALEQRDCVTVVEPLGRDAAIEATVHAAESGATMIVAAGGDGTVSSVVAGLMQLSHRPVLGIVPLGSGNDLARTLAIPLDPLEAVRVLESGAAHLLDVAEASSSKGRRFSVNMLTGGNTARYLQTLTDEMKARWGPLCYLRGVIDVVRDLVTYRVSVTCDDRPPENFAALNLFVANGRFSGGGMAVSPEATPYDGLLDVVIVREGDAGQLASLTANYVTADYLSHELIEFRRAQRLKITGEQPLPLTADGDDIGLTPLTVQVHHQSLEVLLPASTPLS